MGLHPEENLYDYLDNNMARLKFRTHPQNFIPRDVFIEATSRRAIEQTVNMDEDGLDLCKSDLDDFVTEVHQHAPKLFVASVLSGHSMAWLRKLLSEGFNDTNAPQAAEDRPKLKGQQKARFQSFLDDLKKLNAPFFDRDSFQDIDSSKTPIPVDFEEDNKKNLRGKGAFGEVWEMLFHPAQHNLLPGSNIDRFAVKVIQNEVSWMREKKFIKDMARLNHQHLVKCLASWTLGKKYHMVYELAFCNLDEFVQNHQAPSKAASLSDQWLAEQLKGLAGALLVVHNQGEGDRPSTTLAVPSTGPAKTGYIHDIKLENILVYRYRDGSIWFRLSDFSCAKVVDFVNTVSGQRLSHMTESRAGTPYTMAPESNMGKTSRPLDLWSLGCVYMEVLTWYLQGYPALSSFKDDRRQQPRWEGGPEDDAFYFTPGKFIQEDGHHPTWQLRPAVIKKIDELRGLCRGPLKQIIDQVPDLLKINPKDRPDAKQLAQILKAPGSELQLDMSLLASPRRDSLLPSPPLTPKLHVNNHSNETDEADFVMRLQQATE